MASEKEIAELKARLRWLYENRMLLAQRFEEAAHRIYPEGGEEADNLLETAELLRNGLRRKKTTKPPEGGSS